VPQVSHRGDNAHTSPIRKLSPYADAAKRAGKQVYHLNIGQPDIKTPAAALQQVKATEIDILAYSPSAGHATYRQKLPTYYQKFGIEVAPDDILVTNGASEGIYFTLLACLDRGQTVLATEPLYANYVGFAEMADVHIKPVTTVIESGFSLPSIEDFERALTPDVKAILLCNPNNPTGAVYPEKMLRELAELALERDIFLMIDEVYREFCYGDTPFFSALNLPDLHQHVVVFDSVSKRYSACGARVGAIVTRNRNLLSNINKFAEVRLSPPSFGQLLAEALLDTPESYFETIKAEYQQRRDVLFERLNRMEGVTCYRPDGAFYVFAKLPIDDCEYFCKWLLEDFSYNNTTVMLAPGNGFYASPESGKQEVRFAYVLNINDLNAAMDCLEAALQVYRREIIPGTTMSLLQ
jgi:aspartate aminotransferase